MDVLKHTFFSAVKYALRNIKLSDERCGLEVFRRKKARSVAGMRLALRTLRQTFAECHLNNLADGMPCDPYSFCK